MRHCAPRGCLRADRQDVRRKRFAFHVTRIGTPAQPCLPRRGEVAIVRAKFRFFDSLEPSVLFFRYFLAVLPALLVAAPAHASGGVQLPEPSGLFLLSLGVAGVIVGRRLSSKKDKD